MCVKESGAHHRQVYKTQKKAKKSDAKSINHPC